MKNIRKNWLTGLRIVVIAAVLVEGISIVQYESLRRITLEDMNIRTRITLGAMADEISHTLEMTEATMRENLWMIRARLGNPDDMFQAMVYLIDDNPQVVGGCISFIPDHYPSKGRLFEPYAKKEADGTISVSQIAGPDHDYTLNQAFRRALETGVPNWSDPYLYGEPPQSLTTYSYPVRDDDGIVVAVCGLDMDLTWLGEYLNSNQHLKSSFAIMLTEEGKLVAGPSSEKIPQAEVEKAAAALRGNVMDVYHRNYAIGSVQMKASPFWQLAQVYRTREIMAPILKLRRQHMVLVLLGLAILFFMIKRFARSEKELRIATVEKARIDGELTIARNIQSEMLPKTFPENICGEIESALEVGGDIFDFYRRDGQLFFCIGDVSGKGIPAAMLMAVIHSLFREISKREENTVTILQALNDQLCQGNDSNMFVTFFVGRLDLYTGKLYFSNAGHDKPFLLTGSAELLTTVAHLPLGVFPDTAFEEQSCVLSPGDGIFLYTDGLTETKSPARENFGRERVKAVLDACLAQASMTPGEIVDSVSKASHDYSENAPLRDDLTMLLIKFDPGEIVRDQLTIVNDIDEVSRLSAFVKDYFSRLELDRKAAYGMRLALEEAVVNVINYAYPGDETGEVTIYAESDRKEIRFTIVDSGFPFDPTSVLPADTTLDAIDRPIGGLGVHLTRKLADSVSYSRKHGNNVLTLTKSIL